MSPSTPLVDLVPEALVILSTRSEREVQQRTSVSTKDYHAMAAIGG